jgi:hypothetical protein
VSDESEGAILGPRPRRTSPLTFVAIAVVVVLVVLVVVLHLTGVIGPGAHG